MTTASQPSSSGSFAQTVAGDEPGERPVELERGAVIGRYVVLELVGRGGVGLVYAAYDAELDRKVALKLVRSEASSGDRRQRALFEEARSMARLSHPNVVTVHDVGIDRGRLFVAMELVEGQTLHEWLRARRGSVRAIVEAFIAAARGLAAAHEVGLVHRDFKPENVLVGADGRVRVTDFGLAHASTERDVVDDVPSAASSVASAIPVLAQGEPPRGGTPAYMAPEQHAGAAGDAKSDQFSFCVALFEGLWGERPFRGATLAELVGNIIGGRIDEPTGVRVPARLRRIVLRGLACDPIARHGSMAALADALADALAAPRRRIAIAGAATAVALAIGSAVVLSRPAESTLCSGGDRALAGVWDDDARAGLTAALRDTTLPYAEATVQRVTALLDDHAARWIAQHRDACEATNVRGEQSAELMDRRMACLDRQRAQASALVELLRSGERAVLERAVGAAQALPAPERCGELAALLAGSDPPAPERLGEVTALRDALAQAQAHEDAGAYARGLELARDIAARADALGWAPLVAEAYTRAGALAMRAGAPDEARDRLEHAYYTAVTAKHGEVATESATLLAWTLVEGLHRIDEGTAWSKHALAQARAFAPDSPLEGRAWASAGVCANTAGEYADALAHHRRALDIRARTLPADHLDLAQSHAGIATALMRLGETDAALAEQEIAIDIRTRVLGDEHPLVAAALTNLAAILLDAERERDAEPVLRRALAIDERALGPDHPTVAAICENLAIALDYQGRDQEAIPLLRRTLAIREARFGPDHPDVAKALNNLGTTLGDIGELEEASALLQRAIDIDGRGPQPDHPMAAERLGNLASTLEQQGRYSEQLEVARRAWAMVQDSPPGASARVAVVTQLASALLRTGATTEAIALIEPELPEATGIQGGELRFQLGRALLLTGGDRTRAYALVAEAREVFAKGGPRMRNQLEMVDGWYAAFGRGDTDDRSADGLR